MAASASSSSTLITDTCLSDVIPTWDVPQGKKPENVKGIAASAKTGRVYVASLNRMICPVPSVIGAPLTGSELVRLRRDSIDEIRPEAKGKSRSSRTTGGELSVYMLIREAPLGSHLDRGSVARDRGCDPNDAACAARNPRLKTRAKPGHLH
jgi:hypothetical protein